MHSMGRVCQLLTILTLVAVIRATTYTVTTNIDTFETPQDVLQTGSSAVTSTKGDIIGGVRVLSVTGQDTDPEMPTYTLAVVEGLLSSWVQGEGPGYNGVLYDGGESDTVNPAGLGSVDVTAGNGNHLYLSIMARYTEEFSFSIYFYSPDGSVCSMSREGFTDEDDGLTDFYIPFTYFNVTDCDLTNIGAIELRQPYPFFQRTVVGDFQVVTDVATTPSPSPSPYPTPLPYNNVLMIDDFSTDQVKLKGPGCSSVTGGGIVGGKRVMSQSSGNYNADDNSCEVDDGLYVAQTVNGGGYEMLQYAGSASSCNGPGEEGLGGIDITANGGSYVHLEVVEVSGMDFKITFFNSNASRCDYTLRNDDTVGTASGPKAYRVPLAAFTSGCDWTSINAIQLIMERLDYVTWTKLSLFSIGTIPHGGIFPTPTNAPTSTRSAYSSPASSVAPSASYVPPSPTPVPSAVPTASPSRSGPSAVPTATPSTSGSSGVVLSFGIEAAVEVNAMAPSFFATQSIDASSLSSVTFSCSSTSLQLCMYVKYGAPPSEFDYDQSGCTAQSNPIELVYSGDLSSGIYYGALLSANSTTADLYLLGE